MPNPSSSPPSPPQRNDPFIRYGLGLILVFVGLKMVWLNDAFGGKFPITWSLAIIAAILAASVIASLLRPAKASHAAPPAPSAALRAERLQTEPSPQRPPRP